MKEKLFIMHKLSELYNKKIKIPDSLVILYHDSVDYLKNTCDRESNYKIISVINGDCSICVVNMRRWIVLMEDSFSPIKKEICFIVRTHSLSFRKKEMSLLNNFPYPIMIDTLDQFIKINDFPPDTRFHTMLLGKDGKPVLFGDPTESKAILELYLSEIGKIN